MKTHKSFSIVPFMRKTILKRSLVITRIYRGLQTIYRGMQPYSNNICVIVAQYINNFLVVKQQTYILIMLTAFDLWDGI